jgi:hypothetical protein
MRTAAFILLGCMIVLALRGQPAGEPKPPSAGGSCVECHRNVQGVPYLLHNLADWELSAHAKWGVGCQSCHGGDAAAKEKAQAHKGMLPSTDEKSRVYYTAIPATCGSCHDRELQAFQRSAHFRELQSTGRGPNCVTCHGAMANVVMSPQEMERTCTLCHRRPTLAYATLLSLNNASAGLKRLAAAITEARAQGVAAEPQEKERRDAAEIHARSLEDWHTFKMSAVLSQSQEVTKRAANAANELAIKRH